MEVREETSSGVAATVAPAPTVAAAPPPTTAAGPRTDTGGQGGVAAAAPAPAPPGVGPVSVAVAPPKKKRGRPRKYAPDGSVALPAMPISASAPAGSGVVVPANLDFSSAGKRGRGRPTGSLSKPRVDHLDLDFSGDWDGCSVGLNFTPHVITVPAGEDVTMKIISFSQQGPRAICILSANGVISNVTLRQPDSSGGTLTYEGRFEILSLSGSFMPTESGGARSRSGGMSVSLASPDGRVVGGGLAGLLVAASPVQVVIGSFIQTSQHQKPNKKPKLDSNTSGMPTAAIPISSAEMDESYSSQGPRISTAPRANLTTSSSFRGDSWATLPSIPDARNSSSTDINISLPGG